MSKTTSAARNAPAAKAESGPGQRFESAAGTYAAWLRSSSRIQAEIIRFLGDRFRKDADALAQFAACRNPADVLQLQVTLTSTMVSDYADETQRLLALIGEAAAGDADKPG